MLGEEFNALHLLKQREYLLYSRFQMNILAERIGLTQLAFSRSRGCGGRGETLHPDHLILPLLAGHRIIASILWHC